ncbi:MAG: glycosyl hydrolase family 43, partial [Bacteroidota bacterium]|nr:glycosyl hydrolase family 43 [Bacteroidota bacterium]
MQRRSFLKKLCTACIVTYVSPGKLLGAPEKQAIDALKARFQEPLLADRPQVFWFWMNGHVNKEGITLDLEAMKNAGIGGVFNFDAGISIPKGPVAYLSKEWLNLKRHAIAETKRLGLEYVMHNCPGWAASGGPWITPELAMKQLTWS